MNKRVREEEVKRMVELMKDEAVYKSQKEWFEKREKKRMTEMKESVLFSCWTYGSKQVRKLV